MRSRLARSLLAAVVVASVLGPAAFAGSAAADPSLTIAYEGDRATVSSGPAQVVRGTADAPTGTEVLVRVRSTGNTSPAFLKAETAVVTENGTWAVAFNFSDIDAGGTFSLNARFEDDSAEASADGEIVACVDDCTDVTPQATPTPIPEQTATPTSTESGDSPVTFGENIFLVERGGVAAIPVAFADDADAAVIVVGNESDVNYELETVVRDADGDGQAVLYVDTSLAGRGGETVSVSGGDTAEVRSETSLETMVDPANYDVSLYAGTERAADPVDVGSLVVQARSSETATTAATETDRPSGSATDAGGGLGSLALGGLVSGVFLVGGAALAAVLLRG